MADPVKTDSTDPGLILDLTIKRASSFVDSRVTTVDEDVSSPLMDWQEECYLSVPAMCTPSGGYGVEDESPVVTRISNAETAASDNRASCRCMEWEYENRSHSVPILGTSTSRDGDERMLPFKKRRSLHHISPLCPDRGPTYTTTDTPQTDGVTVLVQNMAAMHTDPAQQRSRHRDPEASDVERSGASSGGSDRCALRSRGLHHLQPTPEIQSKTCQGNKLSEPVSTPAVCDSNCDSGIYVNEEEYNVITKPDEDGDLPIHIAAVQGEKEIVARLIVIMTKNGVSIDQMNNLKQTPLHLATITKNITIMKLLLEGGASPNTPDRKGNTCCHLAVKKNAIECLQTIIEYSKEKVDINANNFEGMTPLHQAVKLGHLRCIDFLIQCDAEINIVDGKSGKTPLYLAFECNEKDAADLLLSRGADVNIPTYSGCTLIQAANHRGQKLLNNNFRTPQGRGFPKTSRRKQRAMKSHT